MRWPSATWTAPTPTRPAYRSDWSAFQAWCAQHGAEAMPASQVTLERYLAHLAARGLKVSTIRRARIAALPARSHHEVRDRAIILVGFAGALRASDLVRLDVGNVRFSADGLELALRRSKEDQLGVGTIVRIPRSADPATCPVKALSAWIQRVGRPAGPLFRHVRGAVIEHERLHPRTVTRAVQRAVERAGIAGDYSSHSLRAGLATSAYAHGARETDIRDHGRWKSLGALARYIRLERIRERTNPAAGLL